jgi:hypothetical protein
MQNTTRINTVSATGVVMQLYGGSPTALPNSDPYDPFATYCVSFEEIVLPFGHLRRIAVLSKAANIDKMSFTLMLNLRSSIFGQLAPFCGTKDATTFEVFVDLGPKKQPFGCGLFPLSVLTSEQSLVTVTVPAADVGNLSYPPLSDRLSIKVRILFRVPQSCAYEFDSQYVACFVGLHPKKKDLHFGSLTFWRSYLPGEEPYPLDGNEDL